MTDYDTTKGIVYVVEHDGYYSKEEALVIRDRMIKAGFMVHIAEV